MQPSPRSLKPRAAHPQRRSHARSPHDHRQATHIAAHRKRQRGRATIAACVAASRASPETSHGLSTQTQRPRRTRRENRPTAPVTRTRRYELRAFLFFLRRGAGRPRRRGRGRRFLVGAAGGRPEARKAESAAPWRLSLADPHSRGPRGATVAVAVGRLGGEWCGLGGQRCWCWCWCRVLGYWFFGAYLVGRPATGRGWNLLPRFGTMRKEKCQSGLVLIDG